MLGRVVFKPSCSNDFLNQARLGKFKGPIRLACHVKAKVGTFITFIS
jgi:hypothetical protein